MNAATATQTRKPRRPATYQLAPAVRRALPAIEAAVKERMATMSEAEFLAACDQAARDLGI